MTEKLLKNVLHPVKKSGYLQFGQSDEPRFEKVAGFTVSIPDL